MNKGQKVALKHAANAIDGTRPAGGVKLGALSFVSESTSFDHKGRPLASSYLAQRAGWLPPNQKSAQVIVEKQFGLTSAQVAKLDRLAASTHNIRQRGERVARFLRKCVEQPGYVGINRKATTGAVAASL
jgi:hypothetical protein